MNFIIFYLWNGLCFFRYIIALGGSGLFLLGLHFLSVENFYPAANLLILAVICLTLCIFLFRYKSLQREYSSLEKEVTAHEANAKAQREKTALKRQNELEERRCKIQEKIQSVGFIQKAKIAQNVIKKFPSSEFDQLKPMLTTASKKKDAIRDLNQKLINEYEEALLVQFGQSEPFPTRQDYDHLLKDTMKLGYEAIIEQYSITESSAEGGKPFQESSREISDSGTWQDIKRRA